MSMLTQKAEVADIQRAFQRDTAFIEDVQENFGGLLKLLGNSTYNAYRKYIPMIATTWYYFATSLSNRQTLGEEYAGIIRIVSDNVLPGKLLQFVWLVLFVCGDSAYDKLIMNFRNKISQSQTVTPEVRNSFLEILNFLSRNKNTFKALHRSIFYITGIYYHLSNRLTGIKYLLVRSWMQSATYARGFQLLGKISLLYLVYSLVKDFTTKTSNETVTYKDALVSSKVCPLCGDIRQNTCTTPCGHLFCWYCIHNCLQYQSNCPICRDFVKPSRIVFLQNYA